MDALFRAVRIFQPRTCFWITDALYSNTHMGVWEHWTHSGMFARCTMNAWRFGQVRALWPLQPQSLQVVLPLLERSTGSSFQIFLHPASPSSGFGDFLGDSTLYGAVHPEISSIAGAPSIAISLLAARISLGGAIS